MTSSPMRSNRLQAWLAVAVLVSVAVYVVWDGIVRGRHVLEVSATYGVTVEAPASAPGSPTGYADGRRSLVLPPAAADTAHWIMQTQTMLARGEWRMRQVDYDNAPAGREVHWAAPLHGWLAALAWIDHRVTGRPIGQSVERAVVYSGPVMLAVALAGLVPLLWRRFSVWAAVLAALGVVAVYPFYLDFVAGYADHHGLANGCGLLSVLLLAAAGGTGGEREARRWFLASALAGGAGLWISAATQAPVLLGIGLGLLAAAWLDRGPAGRPVWIEHPGLLRTWGWAGGGASLAAWLLEYFPQHVGLRLEVNHPLYAAAWIGAGETLRVIVLLRREGWKRVTAADRARGAAGAGLALALPLVIYFTAEKTFLVRDPFLWRLHAEYIAEFQGLSRILGRGLSLSTLSLWLPALLLAPVVWRVVRAGSPSSRPALALALVPALLACGMAWFQIRWLGLAFALTIPALAVFFREEEAGRPGARPSLSVWLAVAGLLLAPGLATAVGRTAGAGESTTEDIRNLAMRDLAHWLRLRGGSERIVVAASPSVTTQLIYYGNVTGVGTLYWENLTGLRQVAEFFASPNPAEAKAAAARLGLTHIVLVSWGAFEPTLVRLQRGLAESDPLPADTLAAQLPRSPVPPPWLRAVPFKLPRHPALAEAQVLIWEVVPDQTPAAALAAAANFYLELGRRDEAARLEPALARHEDDLGALVMRAAIASSRQDAAAFGPVFNRILARLSQAEALAFDQQVHLGVVLAVGQRPELAQALLRRTVASADERTLRHLTLGTLNDLLTLTEVLEVPLPDPRLQQLARDLLPPAPPK